MKVRKLLSFGLLTLLTSCGSSGLSAFKFTGLSCDLAIFKRKTKNYVITANPYTKVTARWEFTDGWIETMNKETTVTSGKVIYKYQNSSWKFESGDNRSDVLNVLNQKTLAVLLPQVRESGGASCYFDPIGFRMTGGAVASTSYEYNYEYGDNDQLTEYFYKAAYLEIKTLRVSFSYSNN